MALRQMLVSGDSPMELDKSMGSDPEGRVPMDLEEWETKSCTLEDAPTLVKLEAFMLRVSWNDDIDVSYVLKEEEPSKPWKPTTLVFEYTRTKRKENFDPVESPKKRAHKKNVLFMKGCQCKGYYENHPVGYSVFSLLGAHSTNTEVCIWCSRFGYAVFGHSTLGYCPEKALGLLD